MKRVAWNEGRHRLRFTWANGYFMKIYMRLKRFSHFRPSDLDLWPCDLKVFLPVTPYVGNLPWKFERCTMFCFWVNGRRGTEQTDGQTKGCLIKNSIVIAEKTNNNSRRTKIKTFVNFYRVMRMHSADYAVAWCLFVTRRHSVDTAEHIFKFLPRDACISAVKAVTRCPSVRLCCAKTNKDVFEILFGWSSMTPNPDFKVTIIQRQITRKWYNIELYLQCPTSRKSHMIYGMVPFSVSLNDRYPRFHGHTILWRWKSQKRYAIQWSTNRDLYTLYSNVSFRMALSDLEWLSKIFSDTKRRTVSLRQLSL